MGAHMLGLLELLSQGHSIVYLVPLALGALLFVFQLVGFGLSSATDHDVDHDADVDGDGDLDGDGDVDHDVDHDHDLDHGDGFALAGALRFLNFGRVPFLVVLESLLLSFGVIGLFATQVVTVGAWVSPGLATVAATLPVALVLGVLFSKVLTSILGRMAPTIETKDTRLGRLLGETVVVESATVDANEGRASYKDGSSYVTVYLRTAPGATPIPKGTRVRLERFVPEAKVFICAPMMPEGNS